MTEQVISEKEKSKPPDRESSKSEEQHTSSNQSLADNKTTVAKGTVLCPPEKSMDLPQFENNVFKIEEHSGPPAGTIITVQKPVVLEQGKSSLILLPEQTRPVSSKGTGVSLLQPINKTVGETKGAVSLLQPLNPTFTVPQPIQKPLGFPQGGVSLLQSVPKPSTTLPQDGQQFLHPVQKPLNILPQGGNSLLQPNKPVNIVPQGGESLLQPVIKPVSLAEETLTFSQSIERSINISHNSGMLVQEQRSLLQSIDRPAHEEKSSFMRPVRLPGLISDASLVPQQERTSLLSPDDSVLPPGGASGLASTEPSLSLQTPPSEGLIHGVHIPEHNMDFPWVKLPDSYMQS